MRKVPLWKIYQFAAGGSFKPETKAVFFSYGDAVSFVSADRAEHPDTNGCYIEACYPTRPSGNYADAVIAADRAASLEAFNREFPRRVA